MARKIFLNYRSKESSREAKSLYHCLLRKFPKNQLFMDLAHLQGGQAWLDEIEKHVSESFAIVALIGPDWLNLKDEQGNLRLSQPSDPVRYEIATALRRKVPIIPVLLDDAKLPSEFELPIEMRGMLAWQAMPLRFASFDDDADKLAEALKKHIPARRVPLWGLATGIAGALVVGAALGVGSAAWILGPGRTVDFEPNRQRGPGIAETEARVRLEEDRNRQHLVAELEKARQRAESDDKRRQQQAADLEKAKQRAESDAKELATRDLAIQQRDREIASLRKGQRTTPSFASPYEAVRALQTKLHALSFYNGSVDGISGDRLSRAMASAYGSDIAGRFRELLDAAQREPVNGVAGLSGFASGLIERALPAASAAQRPALDDINVAYATRELPRDGSFPIDSDQIQYKLIVRGPGFDRLVLLDNSVSMQQVELCKQSCDDDKAQKWAINRESREFREMGGKFIFRTDDGRVRKTASGDFDDVIWLRLTQRKFIPKSFAYSLVYRRE